MKTGFRGASFNRRRDKAEKKADRASQRPRKVQPLFKIRLAEGEERGAR